MAFIRIRTINGKEYLYEEHRWRGADGKVKSRSVYLGRGRVRPLSIFSPVPREEQGIRYIERMMERDEAVKVGRWRTDAAPVDKLAEEGSRLAQERDRLHAAKEKLGKHLGVNLFTSSPPAPVEKPPTVVSELQRQEQTASQPSTPSTQGDDAQPDTEPSTEGSTGATC